MREPAFIPLLAGPTAVGKTGIAVQVALRIGAEIVSADSRQVYREFGVAVDKPSEAQRSLVPHHLVDSRSFRDPMSAGVFAREAEACIADILGRGRVPVVVGGSPLYLRALVEGLADIPPVPETVRERVRARLRAEGAKRLHDELLRIDPDYAGTLDATKSQRVLRGLEVYEATGRPLSTFFRSHREPKYNYKLVILDRVRSELYGRIDARVDRMVETGLVDEARRLQELGLDLEANPTRTIGYVESAALLRGEIGLPELASAIRTNSRRYAKRQLTWLRKIPEAEWLNATGIAEHDIVDRVAGAFTKPSPAGAAAFNGN